ncbi:MAG: MxaP protein [Methylococcaceae bacterium]|nr:MxaP protein [Methylococcaceae bacterium]
MKLLKQFIKQIIPKAGLIHFVDTYLTWFTVGFFSAFVAGVLDNHAGAVYAAYYTGAVNEAVGYRFWVLLSVIGILLFCIGLPVIYFDKTFNLFPKLINRYRQFTYTFFVVGFDEGALMIGILSANLVNTSDRSLLLANKSFLFSDVGFLTIFTLALLNSLLWLLGESFYNREDRSYSGIVGQLMTAPSRYAIPCYFLVTGIIIYCVISQ